MTLSEHPLWLQLRPYFQIEECAKDGGHENPRVRIEVDPLPLPLAAVALALRLPCVACGRPTQVVRSRAQSNRSRIADTPAATNLYYAPCCALDVNVGCSRTKSARNEYLRIKMLLRPDLPGGGTAALTARDRSEAVAELAAMMSAPGVIAGPATVRLFSWLATGRRV